MVFFKGKKSALICFGVIIFLCTSTFAAECRTKTRSEIVADFPAVENEITQLMKKTEISGLSLVILKDGVALFTRQYGDALREPLFQAASISKPVATFAALKIVEQGLFSLEKPLSQYVKVPYLPPQDYIDLVTLKTVLNHTSGMGTDVTGEDRKIYFKPGTDYSYSGAGFLYMQQAMQDIVGKGFNALMLPYLRKLGMEQSSYDLFYDGEHWESAAYSLLTTPKELGLIFDELANPHAENRWVAERMTTATVHVDKSMSRGLGVLLNRCGEETAIMHSGRNFSLHHAVAVVYDRSRAGAVVMARGKDSRGIPQRIATMAIGGDLEEHE